MAPARRSPRLALQSHPGIGVRLVRRIGAAMRSVIAGGITLAVARRRPSAPHPGIGHALAKTVAANPAPSRAPRPCQPRTLIPSPRPSRPGWLARLFRRRVAAPGPAPAPHLAFAADSSAPFTPEAYPGLSPEFCALLNTPLEECDPGALQRLLAASAQAIAKHAPPELGMTDLGALFSMLADRLAAQFKAAGLDLPPISPPPTLAHRAPPAPPALASVRKQTKQKQSVIRKGRNQGQAPRPRSAAIDPLDLMWRPENRRHDDRRGLRHPSDLTDQEWASIRLLIPPSKRGGNRRTVDTRQVVNAAMYLLGTGCRWRALPEDLPPRSTVHDYVDRWSHDGTLERMHRALHARHQTVPAFKSTPAARNPTATAIDSHAIEAPA